MPRIVLTSSLLALTGGEKEITVEGGTVEEALIRLEERHPRLKGWIRDEKGRIRPHVNLFVNAHKGGLQSKVGPDDELFVIQAISGGTHEEAAGGNAKRAFRL